jgi:hypothetical protein
MVFLDVCQSFMAFNKISYDQDHVVALLKTKARKMSMLRMRMTFSKEAQQDQVPILCSTKDLQPVIMGSFYWTTKKKVIGLCIDLK